MQKMRDLNLSQENIINKLQNQLLECEQKSCKVVDELENAKKDNDELLKKMMEKNKKILKIEEELKTSINDKIKFEKELNHKLQLYKNKLEVSVNTSKFNYYYIIINIYLFTEIGCN